MESDESYIDISLKQELNFPAWTMAQLLVFLLRYWVFSQVAGFVISVSFILLNKWLSMGFDGRMDVFIGKYLSALVCQLVLVVYGLRHLRLANHNFQDVWGKLDFNWFWAIFAMISSFFLAILGASLNGLWSNFDNSTIESVSIVMKYAILIELPIIAITTPIIEESLFRGVIFRAILKKHHLYSSVFLSSFIFMIYHILLK
jgi:membrane protease YdiL (CAAX protease family)